MLRPLKFAICIVALIVGSTCQAAESKGAGSTFVSPVIAVL
jgi:hypothetical protein